MLTFEELLEAWDGETAVVHRDRESGAWIFVCLHSTRRGPAGGGTRMNVYGTWVEALQDAMRLSAAMTRKLAIRPDLEWRAKLSPAQESSIWRWTGRLLRHYGYARGLEGLAQGSPVLQPLVPER